MSQGFNRFLDSIYSVFFDRIRFSEDIDRIFLKPLRISIFLRMAASISIANGTMILYPPYSKMAIGILFLYSVGVFSLLSISSYILGSLTDHFSQQADRPSKSRMMIYYADYSWSLFLLYMPVSNILFQIGFTGFGGNVFLISLFSSLYFYQYAKGNSVLYTLKESDALKITFKSFAIYSFFPTAFFFFTATGIMGILS